MTRCGIALLWSLVGMGACLPADMPRGPRVGEPAIEYVAATLEGDSVSLASLRGEVVLLNLWATWCVPCRTETPYLQSLYEERADAGFRIVGVSLDTGGTADQVAAFVEEYGITYTILHDPQMRGMDLYQILGLPATFLIDREGVLRWMRFGPIAENDPAFLGALDDALS
ncbi:MAG TPA: TlpA disulfide reductase family protein [Longimicrobiales bacterium]|nr:TlpA disulfide reductase family protein [Longimicrobiales bacterium]